MPDANDLNLEEWREVVALIRRTVDEDKFPLSDGVQRLRSALAKLDPKSAPKAKPAPPPPLYGLF